MMQPRVLSLDPGGTTGWMSWNPYVDEAVSRMSQGQLGPGDHHSDLWSLLEEEAAQTQVGQRFLIISESFEYRNNLPKAELTSVEYIGIVKLFAETHAGVDVVWQTASMGKVGTKSFVKQRNLERMFMWLPGKPHANDATSHFVYYVIHGGNPAFAELRTKFLEMGWKNK